MTVLFILIKRVWVYGCVCSMGYARGFWGLI